MTFQYFCTCLGWGSFNNSGGLLVGGFISDFPMSGSAKSWDSCNSLPPQLLHLAVEIITIQVGLDPKLKSWRFTNHKWVIIYNGFILQMTGISFIGAPMVAFSPRPSSTRSWKVWSRSTTPALPTWTWSRPLGGSGQIWADAEYRSAVDVVCCHCSIFVCNLMNIWYICLCTCADVAVSNSALNRMINMS